MKQLLLLSLLWLSHSIGFAQNTEADQLLGLWEPIMVKSFGSKNLSTPTQANQKWIKTIPTQVLERFL